jgi:hypothetical protein
MEMQIVAMRTNMMRIFFIFFQPFFNDRRLLAVRVFIMMCDLARGLRPSPVKKKLGVCHNSIAQQSEQHDYREHYGFDQATLGCGRHCEHVHQFLPYKF